MSHQEKSIGLTNKIVLTRSYIIYTILYMWNDFTKNMIPQTPVLTKEDMELYKRYMKDINYTIYNGNIAEGIKKRKSKRKKSFNRTSCKNKA